MPRGPSARHSGSRLKGRAQHLGELSAQLEKAERARTELHPERGKQAKAATLKEAAVVAVGPV